MKRFILFILVFLLTACAAPATSTPTIISASATPAPEATVTLSPSPTQTSPIAKAIVDPLAWYSAGVNGEIVGQEGDLCLFDTTEQCFKFASPEVAVEARDGLQRATLVMWWAESAEVRAQYGSFEKFVTAVRAQPLRSDGLLMKPDERANRAPYYVDGYNPIDPETGKPIEIDYSRYSARVIDAPTAKAEGIVFSGFGGWYEMNQSWVKAPDGKWIIKYTILDDLTLPDSSGYGGLPLNPDSSSAENALAMNQAINFFLKHMARFENMSSYSTFDGENPLNLAYFPTSEYAMPNAAKGTVFFVPR